MGNVGYLYASYAIVWAVLFGYVLMLVNRQRKLSQDIELLKKNPLK